MEPRQTQTMGCPFHPAGGLALLPGLPGWHRSQHPRPMHIPPHSTSQGSPVWGSTFLRSSALPSTQHLSTAHPHSPQSALEQPRCLHKMAPPVTLLSLERSLPLAARLNIMWQQCGDRATAGQETRRGLGSCTRHDCTRAQSCLLSRGISVTQLNHLVRRHYLLQRKRGASRGELAARRFTHHYVPLAALKSESRGSSYSLSGLLPAWAEAVVGGPRGGCAAPMSRFSPRVVTLWSISRSHHCMAQHPGRAACGHRSGLQGWGQGLSTRSSDTSLFQTPG